MTENTSRYYVAELEERLALLAEATNEEHFTKDMFLQVAAATLVLPVILLLIGWVLL